MQDSQKSYENICKLVGKLVIDFSFDMEKLNLQNLSLLEKLAEKDKKIKELENKVES